LTPLEVGQLGKAAAPGLNCQVPLLLNRALTPYIRSSEESTTYLQQGPLISNYGKQIPKHRTQRMHSNLKIMIAHESYPTQSKAKIKPVEITYTLRE
jgi:hypothetical protein